MLITIYKRRGTTEEVTFKDKNGDALALNAGDVVRVKIGRQGSTPILDIASNTSLAGGTTIQKGSEPYNPVNLIFAPSDLTSITPGLYDVEALVVDSADSNRPKHAEMGVCQVIETQQGST